LTKKLNIKKQELKQKLNTHVVELNNDDIKLIIERREEMRLRKVKGIPHEKVIADLRNYLKNKD
jgi:glutamate synthase domain-containing protein 3